MEIENESTQFEGESDLRGGKWHIWRAISSQGRISLYTFNQNFNAALYTKTLKYRISEMKRKYPEGFIFMVNNDPKHTSNLAKNYMNDNFMETLG